MKGSRSPGVLVSCALFATLILSLHGRLAFPQSSAAATIPTVHFPDRNQAAESTTTLRLIFILAEFPDAKLAISVDHIKKRIIPELIDYYREVSYGGVLLAAEVAPRPVTVPKQLSSYGNLKLFAVGSDPDLQSRWKQLAEDVIRAADDVIDYRRYDVPVIVIPSGRTIAWAFPKTIAVTTKDGVTVTQATLQPDNSSTAVFAHELGHILGLFDLYDHFLADKLGNSNDAAVYVGPWCLMSLTSRGAIHFCAYNKIQLGWISSERVASLPRGSTGCVPLEPLETKSDGFQVLKVPLYGHEYYLVEYRQKIGFDAVLPDSGALITRVNSSIRGEGAVRVVDADQRTKSLDDATFDARPGKENIFIDKANNLAIVVPRSENDRCVVCVTTPDLSSGISKLTTHEVSLLCEATSELNRMRNARLTSPEAQSILKEVEKEWDAAIIYLASFGYDQARRKFSSVSNLMHEAFSVQQRYAEVNRAIAEANGAIGSARSAGRTRGLEKAEALLAECSKALDAYDYTKSLMLAAEAKQAAEKARAPTILDLYGWYIGVGLAAAALVGILAPLVKRKTRKK